MTVTMTPKLGSGDDRYVKTSSLPSSNFSMCSCIGGRSEPENREQITATDGIADGDASIRRHSGVGDCELPVSGRRRQRARAR